MSLTTDPTTPCLREYRADGQQECYLILSQEERGKGFVRPVRQVYRHVGIRPKYPTRELTADEHERYDQFGYVLFEPYPEEAQIGLGRYWTEAQLNSGCRSETTMGLALSETWARKIDFYGATFCCACGKHFPVEEFIWVPDGSVLGT